MFGFKPSRACSRRRQPWHYSPSALPINKNPHKAGFVLQPVQQSVSQTPGRAALAVFQHHAHGGELVADAAEVEALIAARLAARAGKDWAESDRIRDQLTAMGVVLEDRKGGTTWRLAV